jgi:hypothetical protein
MMSSELNFKLIKYDELVRRIADKKIEDDKVAAYQDEYVRDILSGCSNKTLIELVLISWRRLDEEKLKETLNRMIDEGLVTLTDGKYRLTERSK